MADSEGTIKVAVTGAAGRMGIEVVKTVSQAEDMRLVGAVDRAKVGSSAKEVAGPEADDLEISSKLGEILDRETPDVLVDFTNASAAPANSMSCLERKIAVVIGASGLGNEDQRSLGETAREKETPCLLVPNFAIGAVLMMRFSEMAAKWMKDVSIVELHHDKKIDAPSGTASATAHLIANAKGDNYVKRSPKEQINVEGARGGFLNGVNVHSIRLRGLVAHQRVHFGNEGEMLTLSHDSLDRSSFMEGVKLAVREVRSLGGGFHIGLDKVMFG